MGKYTPAKPSGPKSLAETLTEAEEDHYLDCPNADFPLRAAALLLDLILSSLGNSGIQHFFDTLESYAAHLLKTAPPDPAAMKLASLALYLALVVKVSAAYLYFVWAVNRFGGSPGKLLLGLRIVDEKDGRPLRPIVALVRETVGKALSVMSLVGIALPLWRPDGRALHDLISRSVVKKVHGS